MYDFFDTVYAILMVVNLTAIVLSSALLIGYFVQHRRGHPRAEALRLRSAVAAVVGFGLLVVTFALHLGFGHTPGSPHALAPLAFFSEHRAFLVLAVAALGLYALARRWATPRPSADP